MTLCKHARLSVMYALTVGSVFLMRGRYVPSFCYTQLVALSILIPLSV